MTCCQKQFVPWRESKVRNAVRLQLARGVSLQEKAYKIFLDLKILRFWDRICGFCQIFSGFFGFFLLSTMALPSIKTHRNDSSLENMLPGHQKVRNSSTGKCNRHNLFIILFQHFTAACAATFLETNLKTIQLFLRLLC